MAEESRNLTKANYVKICMELDISKELPNSIQISLGNKVHIQQIIYDNNIIYCNHCHMRGHAAKFCFRAHPELRKKMNSDEAPTRSSKHTQNTPLLPLLQLPNCHVRFEESVEHSNEQARARLTNTHFTTPPDNISNTDIIISNKFEALNMDRGEANRGGVGCCTHLAAIDD